jgi:hypothetical protein
MMDFLETEKAGTEEKAAAEDIGEMIQVEQTQQTTTERVIEENALVRRVDLVLMSALWFMYLFSYADRTK